MTLGEFRRLTAHLPGERELLCAGAEIKIVWHNSPWGLAPDDGFVPMVSIDDGDVEHDEHAVVLWRDCPERSCRFFDDDAW